MRTMLLAVLALGLSGCVTPQDAEVLTGDALAARLSGQELRLRPPAESDFDGLVFVARLRPNGIADMSAEADGKPVDLFSDTERWRVEGQSLCIFDGAGPDRSDCIRVDWIAGNRLQLTETRPGGARETSTGTMSPL